MTQPTWVLSVYLGAWIPISNYVLDDSIDCKWGINGNTFFDRLAGTGTMKFQLNNSTGIFTPGGVSVTSSLWKKGAAVKLVFTFDGRNYYRFYGHINSIDIDTGVYGTRRVTVTVTDWMDFAAKYPLTLANKEVNKTADQSLTTLVGKLPIAPAATSYDVGDSLFPTVFDTVTDKTRAYTEMSKLVNSELGYCYLRKTPLSGETLVFESFSRRNGARDLTRIPVLDASMGFLLLESSTNDALVMESSTNDTLGLDQTQTFTADGTMNKADVEYGKNVINYMKVTAHPKDVDANITTLFRTRRRHVIGAGETIVIKGEYRDEQGGNKTNADDATMIEPIANTDYTVFTNRDGTGTDLTSDCTIASDFGTDSFECTITNGSSYKGFVYLAIRGYRIFEYDPISYEAEDAASYTAQGYESKTLDQIYQQELNVGKLSADSVVELEKDPRVVLKKVTFWNTTDELNLAFLNLDVGDIVCIKEDQAEIDGYYYIQAVEFSLHPKGIIMFSWIVRQFFTLAAGLSLVGCEFVHASPSHNVVNYGYIPAISEAKEHRSFSAWIYLHSDPTGGNLATILSNFSDDAGVIFHVDAPQSLRYYQKGVGGAGGWITADNIVGFNAWLHVMVTRDGTLPTNQPIIYLEGAAVAITEQNPQAGMLADETGNNFLIGNILTADPAYQLVDGFDGLLADVRVYDRILTATEAAQIHTEGIGGTGVTSGLIFQGPVIRTKDLTLYTDLTLTSSNKLLDAMYGYVGTPSGSPISRILP
jgi:hypothetical protein